jgi:hypothetical protein
MALYMYVYDNEKIRSGLYHMKYYFDAVVLFSSKLFNAVALFNSKLFTTGFSFSSRFFNTVLSLSSRFFTANPLVSSEGSNFAQTKYINFPFSWVQGPVTIESIIFAIDEIAYA